MAAVERSYQILTFEDRLLSDQENALLTTALQLGDAARQSLRGRQFEHYVEELSSVRQATCDALAQRDDEWLERSPGRGRTDRDRARRPSWLREDDSRQDSIVAPKICCRAVRLQSPRRNALVRSGDRLCHPDRREVLALQPTPVDTTDATAGTVDRPLTPFRDPRTPFSRPDRRRPVARDRDATDWCVEYRRRIVVTA